MLLITSTADAVLLRTMDQTTSRLGIVFPRSLLQSVPASIASERLEGRTGAGKKVSY